MNKKLLVLVICYSWGLLLPTPNAFMYVKAIHEAIEDVLAHPMDSKLQKDALERAKAKCQEAITAEGVSDCAELYAIAGILLDDHLLAARAVELEKKATRQNTVTLQRKHARLEDYAEGQLEDVILRLELNEKRLKNEFLHVDEFFHLEEVVQNLRKTKRWLEAQCIAHGMIRKAVDMYKNNKEGVASVSKKQSKCDYTYLHRFIDIYWILSSY